MTRASLLLVDHSAELGGAELALYDYARFTASVCAIVFEQGPFVDLLKSVEIPVEILDGGSVLELRRDNGWISVVNALPHLGGLALRLAHRMRHADVVYANSQKALVVTALANAIARKPLIWHLHDILTAEHFSTTMRRSAIALSNRFVTDVIANSTATADAYRATGGHRPVTVVHNGIDPAAFDRIDRNAARATLSSEIGSGQAPVLALFGRLSPWKGQNIAIEALRHLPECHLALIGSAMFGDEAFERQLHNLAQEANVANRVHFLGFRKDVAPLMAAADIVLHCSTAPEPFGRVIAEAMMAGTPVIATAAGGALEIITSDRSGFLTPPGNATALSQAVRTLLDQPERAAAMGLSARADALARFSLATAVARINSVVNGARRPHADTEAFSG